MIDLESLYCPSIPGPKAPCLVGAYYLILVTLSSIGILVCPEAGELKITFSGRDDGWRMFGPRLCWTRWRMALVRIPNFIESALAGVRCANHDH